MLSDDALEKLIQPFVERQEKLNATVIGIIAQRIKELRTVLPSDIYKLQRLFQNGADVRKIYAEIQRVTNMQVKEIRNILQAVALHAYLDAKPLYDFRQKPFIPFAENKQLQRVIKAIEKQTVGTFKNLSKAQAFMLRDPKNPKNLIPTPMSKAYNKVIDEAVQASQQGVIPYNQAMSKTIKELVDSGIQSVEYTTEKGRVHHQRVDTAARRNILDGIRAVNQGVQDVVGEQFGATGKEITVHANSAPDHEPVQGHQFTLEEYEKLQHEQSAIDFNGITFPPMRRAIGVLNCRHFTYSIILGVSKPIYTLEQLEEFKRKNAKGYTTANGKHYTMYECTQVQRRYETDIRRAKELYIAARAAGNDELMKATKSRIADLVKQYQSFSNHCGLKVRGERTRVPGYK